jgi:MFS superfamily sulfate permease-like transporter
LFSRWLNLIPLASVAAVLFSVGYKLARPALFVKLWREGWYRFLPFALTILGLVFTDLLTGVAIGMAAAVFFILLENYKCGVYLHEQHGNNRYLLEFSEQVTFLNKANLLAHLEAIPPGVEVVIDGSQSRYIDYDVLEIINNFKKRPSLKAFV